MSVASTSAIESRKQSARLEIGTLVSVEIAQHRVATEGPSIGLHGIAERELKYMLLASFKLQVSRGRFRLGRVTGPNGP